MQMVSRDRAHPGRAVPVAPERLHAVLGCLLTPPYPENCEVAGFAMGCFWGTEQTYWSVSGVVVTAVGYAGGYTPNPTYDEVLTGMTGHCETALVVYDPQVVSFVELVKIFFEAHDPTGSMRQGIDLGTHYRSMIFAPDRVHCVIAEEMRLAYQRALLLEGFGPVRTEIEPLGAFYFAESAHQQYLARHRDLKTRQRPTGIAFPVDSLPSAD